MRFRNLLGLLAIGGAVAYAQKRRGRDLSFSGIKDSLKNAVENLRARVDELKATSTRSQRMTNAASQESNIGTSDLGTSARSEIADEYAGTSGYTDSYDTGASSGSRKL